jgi:hypothetical protein
MPQKRFAHALLMRSAALLSARVGRVQICVHNEQLVVLRSCEVSLTSLGARHGSRVSGEVDVSAVVHHGGQRDQIQL